MRFAKGLFNAGEKDKYNTKNVRGGKKR